MAFESALSFLTELERSCGLDEFPKYRQENAGKSEAPFLLLFVGFTLSVYAMETYLDLRQHRNLKAKSPPPALLDVLKTVDEDNKGLEAVSKVRFPQSGVPPPFRRLSAGGKTNVCSFRANCTAVFIYPTAIETNIRVCCCFWCPPHDVPDYGSIRTSKYETYIDE